MASPDYLVIMDNLSLQRLQTRPSRERYSSTQHRQQTCQDIDVVEIH